MCMLGPLADLCELMPVNFPKGTLFFKGKWFTQIRQIFFHLINRIKVKKNVSTKGFK